MQYLEGGWAYTGFCRAVHSAGVSLKFIKSSKRQTRKGRNSHTWGCVWGDGHSKMPKEKWQVLERAYRSWLVKRKRQELADQTLVPMSVCLSVRQCWCKGVCVCVWEYVCVRGQCFFPAGCRYGAKRTGAWQWMQRAQSADCWLNSDTANPTGDGVECEVTRKLRVVSCRKKTICRTLRMPVLMSECVNTYVCVCVNINVWLWYKWTCLSRQHVYYTPLHVYCVYELQYWGCFSCFWQNPVQWRMMG